MYASIKEKRRIQRKLEHKRHSIEGAGLTSMFTDNSGKVGLTLTRILNIPAYIMILLALIH